jgi:hypothetical protein
MAYCEALFRYNKIMTIHLHMYDMPPAKARYRKDGCRYYCISLFGR